MALTALDVFTVIGAVRPGNRAVIVTPDAPADYYAVCIDMSPEVEGPLPFESLGPFPTFEEAAAVLLDVPAPLRPPPPPMREGSSET